MAEPPIRPGAGDGVPADELGLSAAARSVRRGLGPTAGAVLEELTTEGSPDADTGADVVLRIGHGTAHELVRIYQVTGGRDGLPVESLGRTLRGPRAALPRLLCTEDAKGVIGHG